MKHEFRSPHCPTGATEVKLECTTIPNCASGFGLESSLWFRTSSLNLAPLVAVYVGFMAATFL